MVIKSYFHVLLLVFISISLLACGGGSGNNDDPGPVQQGQFIDSIVIGLRYETPSVSGFTDAQGRFNYRAGEIVRFFVGDVFLGEAVGQVIITPIELVAGATDENNTQVLNIVMFLQSIDDDGDESNGIKITNVANNAAAGQSVDFTLAEGVFETNGAIQVLLSTITSSNGEARPMVSRTQARDTFRNNLLGLLAGKYQGSFAGDDAGTWSVTIDTDGNITGVSVSDVYGSDTVSGSVGSNGQGNMDGTVGGSTFSGNFNRNGTVSGTWSDGEDSGTFTGNRISSTPPPAGGDSGSLSIAGADSSVVGMSFTPNLEPVVIDFNTGNVAVSWAQQIFTDSEFESRQMLFTFNKNDGSLQSIGYLRLTGTSPTNPTSFYSYQLDCEFAAPACASITLDIGQGQVTFSTTSLIADNETDATDAIILNGTLRW